jgi:hypothetical protein
MFLGSKAWISRKGDNLTAIYEPLSKKHGILDISKPYRHPWPVTGTVLLLVFNNILSLTYTNQYVPRCITF